MKLVLISGQYKVLIRKLEQIEEINIKVNKIIPPRVYFSVETSNDINQIIKQIKRTIHQDKKMRQMVYEIYGFYNGKIDLVSYLSDEKKNQLKYYVGIND